MRTFVKRFFLSTAIIFATTAAVFAQGTGEAPRPQQKLSARFAAVLDTMKPGEVVSDERRQKAYVKLFEAQRLLWRTGRLRSRSGISTTTRAAEQSLVEALEFNPRLAEAYTALSELVVSSADVDLDEAIALAELAVLVDEDNFGGRRILGRLYTFKSRIASDSLDKEYTAKAIAAWKEITRLDPRNAEAWAFLSNFYAKLGDTEAEIDALKKWQSSAVPLETEFYARLIGGGSTLSFDEASLKLGRALIAAGREREAIEVLSGLIADSPEDMAAVELLREAVTSGGGEGSEKASEALQQAVFANSDNASLISLLAEVHFNAGQFEEGAKLLRSSSQKFLENSPEEAGNFLIVLGDLYAERNKFTEAIASYEDALKIRGFTTEEPVTDDDREYVTSVFTKLIKTYGFADRDAEIAGLIARARKLLGEDDLFADLQLISHYRENGDRNSALSTARSAREKHPGDIGLRRLEATLLTELGRVDEAVELIRGGALSDEPVATGKTTENSSTATISFGSRDTFSDQIFISSLYTKAGRSKDAANAANEALATARSDSRKQIAQLTLASAQQAAGEFVAAEKTLRDILRQSPGNPVALNNLGYFLLERDERFDEALAMIKKAVEIDPSNPSYRDSLGWAYFKKGNYLEAERHLKMALRGSPESATINEHLGDLYFKTGKREMAERSWKRALELSSDGADLTRLRAKIAVEPTR